VSIQLARDFLHQWCSARHHDSNTTTQSINKYTRWQPPVTGTVKCNIDAALFNDQHKFGVGMCIRNNQGRFVKAKTMWFDGNPPPKEAEACALKEGISWLGELEFSKVVIELDCMLVVNAIKNNSNNRTEFGLIIRSCRELLRNYQNFEIVFVKRSTS
jgi:ribonuclease HI